jgi:uncharacterized protein Usg
MIIIKPKEIVSVDIFYYLPDYPLLLGEFYWQTDDYWPEIPRVHRFLGYWRSNIEAIVQQVYIQHASESSWKQILGE